jgi:hypothetical protein
MSTEKRTGGRTVDPTNVLTSSGGVKASLYVKRLQNMLEDLDKQRAVIAGAIEVIKSMAEKNRRMGSHIGRRMPGGDLMHRGLVLTGTVEEVAQTVADLSEKHSVQVYKWASQRALRVVLTGSQKVKGELVGTYDMLADYRTIMDDVRAAGYSSPRQFKDGRHLAGHDPSVR